MKVLLIGSGGREHALAWKLCQSARLEKLYASPGSDAIQSEGVEIVELTNSREQVRFAKQKGIDLVVIGPEKPLVTGLADVLRAEGILVFGPNADAARLEGSKWFAKSFMQRHSIPTAQGKSFTQLENAEQFLQQMRPPYVLKADGLTAGKGVSIHHNLADARYMLAEILGGRFGEAGNRVLLEEFLAGEEASCFVFTDGKHYSLSPVAQDHKPVFDGDQGLNTGGMGAYAPAPLITQSREQQILETIVRPTMAGLQAEGIDYRGVLYVGLMFYRDLPFVVEYNCRFGDPECQPLMLLLKSDLLELLHASATGKLQEIKPLWHPGSATCVVMSSEGYPGKYKTGLAISGLDAQGQSLRSRASTTQANKHERTKIFHAGTACSKNQTADNNTTQWQTNGGRVLGICAQAETLEKAVDLSYDSLKSIHWQGAHYRTDIAQKALARF